MEAILKYFPNLSDVQIKRYEQLYGLYTCWNEKINLVSRKDIDQLYVRHVLHSLAIAKFISFKSGTTILDVGTGGGFPGIPLAIMFPDSEFLLIDSIAKKIKVVNDVVENLKLKNCEAKVARAEQMKDKYDFIVSRAVAQLPKFYEWVKNNLKGNSLNEVPNGIIFLKGGDLTDEIVPFKKYIKSIDIQEYFDDDFFQTKKIVHLFK